MTPKRRGGRRRKAAGSKSSGDLDQIDALSRKLRASQYPASRGVPLLALQSEDLKKQVLAIRRKRELHPLIGRFVKELAARLGNHFMTVTEIQAVAGARNDALSSASGCEILWEFFGTAGRVEEDLRKLERDKNPNRLKVAVVLDAAIDAKLNEEFIRRVQGSPVHYVTFYDLMLAERFGATSKRVARWIEELHHPDWPDQLEVVDFDIVQDLVRWEKLEAIPFGYNGLKGHRPSEPIQDPAFFVDILNRGTREARIGAAFINVRFRQKKFHGFTEGNLLTPTCTIELPLNNGEQGYRSVELSFPVLVRPGCYVRINVLLKDAGYAWRGEVEIGLIYGGGRRLVLPALSLLV